METFLSRAIFYHVALLIALASLSNAQNSCSPGYYLPPSSTDCAACPAGTYQPNSGATGCIPCANGFISTSDASTSCTACGTGETSNTYHTFCICKPGYEFDYYGEGCTACPAGSYGVSYGDDYSYCSQCNANTYQPDAGSTECLNCPSGSKSSCGASECISCSSGQAAIGGSCGVCQPGYYYDSYCSECYECYPGSYQPDSGLSQLCQTCATGSFSGFGYSACVPCKKGTALMADGSCKECPAGQYYDMYSLGCYACYSGSFTPKKGIYQSCFNCGPDGFSFEGSKKCKKCKEGETLLESGKCGTCPPGTYLEVYNNRKCSPCEGNTFGSGGIMEYCQSCPTGTSSLPGSSMCTTCPEGQALIVGMDGCATCPPGKYYSTYTATCDQCPDGSFKASSGLGDCESCPDGSSSSDDYTACIVN